MWKIYNSGKVCKNDNVDIQTSILALFAVRLIVLL